MNRKWSIRIIAIILALLLIGAFIVGAIGSLTAEATASRGALNDLEDQADDLEQKKQEIQAEINSLEYEQSSAMAKKEILDEQIELTQEEIQNTNDQITEYIQLIAKKEVEVTEAQIAEDEQRELYKTRMRAMEENGTISYIAVIFEASSFADLLARIDFVGEVMEFDENLYQQLNEAKEATIAAKNDLEDAKTDQEDLKAELLVREDELNEQVNEASALLIEIESNLDTFTALYEEAEAEEAAVQEQINQMVAELERQEAGSVAGTGSFIWPTPSCYIVTSEFGMRLHPKYNVYKMHNGIDIGASYGSKVLAADSGTVLTSKHLSGYGDCIIISHGNGTTTLYAHLSSRKVSAGDTVTQGDLIGLIGNSGVSTGPHLHFEISVNGSRVNPLNYFTGYTIR